MEEKYDLTSSNVIDNLIILNTRLKVLQDKFEELIEMDNISISSAYHLNKAKEALILSSGRLALHYSIYGYNEAKMAEYEDIIILDQPHPIRISDIRALIVDILDSRTYQFGTFGESKIQAVFNSIEDAYVWIMEEVKSINKL